MTNSAPMRDETKTAIKAILASDPGLSAVAQKTIFARLREPATQGEPKRAAPPRWLRRAEAAKRLGYSLRMVDLLTKQGHLTKVKLPGRQRCAGFLESDVEALIMGRST